MTVLQRIQAWWRRRTAPPPSFPESTDVQPMVSRSPVDAEASEGRRALARSPDAPVERRADGPVAQDAAKTGAARRVTRPEPTGPQTLPGSRFRLALQGGGSHGAFTWGVLDRLLEDDGPGIDAISGASAGAMNAAVLATGWRRDGRAGARAALAGFWRDVAQSGALFSPLPAPEASPQMFGFDALAGYDWGRSVMRAMSPYDFNPLNINPLRDVVARHVDEDALKSGPIRLFVTATAVRSGRPRVFSGGELGIDALLASACLPFLFHAVEIDGEPYWDGGYSGNPSLYPLIEPGGDCDLVVVRINPARREGTPRRSMEIVDRVNEITFNAGLIGELRAIALVNRLLREGELAQGRYRELRFHVIADDDDLAALPASSKLRADRAFIDRLFGFGRAAAERFLASHGDTIGRCSSVDVEAEFALH